MTETLERTRYHLTGEHLRFYDDNGYLILRNWVPRDLLARLQAAGNAWIEQGLHAPEDQLSSDFVFAKRPAGRVMFRVNYVHNKGEAASLELLGSPAVLGVAESMCGPNFVPTYESMVFKQEGDGEAIPWHQDAVQPNPRKWRIFNFDLYLDESRIGAGALRVIPGTHLGKQDICALTNTFGWDHPDAIDVEMAPGDVLLHNVMVVHGSARAQGNALRRTIYYEFRPAEEILEDGPWDRDWIDRRLRLIPVALRAYARAHPNGEQFTWKATSEFKPPASAVDSAELKIAHTAHMVSSFCSAGDAKKAIASGSPADDQKDAHQQGRNVVKSR